MCIEIVHNLLVIVTRVQPDQFWTCLTKLVALAQDIDADEAQIAE